MNLVISIAGIGGHTEVAFSDKEIALEWKGTQHRERVALSALVEKAVANGLNVVSVEDGDEEMLETATPVAYFHRPGKLFLRGKEKDFTAKAALLAEGLVEMEVADGRLVLEANDQNEWKVVKQIDAKKSSKVTSSAKVAGG